MRQIAKQTEQKGITERGNRVIADTFDCTRVIKWGWEDMRGVGGFM
jgi:hypothetical protein